jgi:hypothetical protein
MSDYFTFENESATGDDPESIYSELGAETMNSPPPKREGGRQQKERVDPKTAPIHCFGGSSASISAAASGTITCTPAGVGIRPDSMELSDAQAALATVTGLTVGGLPIMHGGSMPGDSFKGNTTYKLRPSLVASSNNPLVMTVTNIHTAAVVFVLGVKGPTKR